MKNTPDMTLKEEVEKELKHILEKVPVLYKYLDFEGAIKMIRSHTLKFASIPSFNDPFDCHAGLIDWEHMPEEYERQWNANPLKKQLYPYYRQQEIINHVGVASLTESYNNLALWNYYNYHRGICIVLDTQKLSDYILKLDKTIVLVKMKYENGESLLEIDPKKCNPQKAIAFLDGTSDGIILNGIIKQKRKYDPSYATSGVYKSAYIILFKYTGYNYLLNDHYQRLKNQIEKPDNTFPRIYSTPISELIPDGVCILNEKDLKGFSIILTLKWKVKSRFIIFIPIPTYSFEQTLDFAKTFSRNRMIKFQPLPNDCITNEADTRELHIMLE